MAFDADGAERALLRGMVSSVFVAVTVYAITFPSIPSLFPSEMMAREVRGHRLRGSASGLDLRLSGAEPRLPARHATRFTDGAGRGRIPRMAAHAASRWSMRVSERTFVQRANALGVRLPWATASSGSMSATASASTIAVFYSAGDAMSALTG